MSHIGNFVRSSCGPSAPLRRGKFHPCQKALKSVHRRHSIGQFVRNAKWLVQCKVGEEEAIVAEVGEDVSVASNGATPPLMDTQTEQAALEGLEEVEKEEEIEFRGESVAAWVGAAAAFGAGIWYFLGAEKAEEYFAGYLLEQSLSVDNLFVFILVFNFFQTPAEFQPKVLNYGIISAAVLRLVMILLGVELVENFKPVLLAFAGLLIYSSYSLLFENEDEDEDLNDNAIVKLCRKVMTISSNYNGDNFFTVENGVKMATPLLLTLAVVELSDVVFAVDSIPAVFGVTLDPFIVYTSNLFAIMSLRSLYGFVSVVMSELRYLGKAVALVLGFIGGKMIADFDGLHISTDISLLVVGVLLSGGVAASLLLPEPAEEKN